MSFTRPPNPNTQSPVPGQQGTPQPVLSMTPNVQQNVPPSAAPSSSAQAPPPGVQGAAQARSLPNKSNVQVTQRFQELLEQLKNEFVNEAVAKSQTKESADPKLIQQHISDLTEIRKTIFDLHQAHQQMREQYNSEVTKLRNKLDELTPQPPIIGLEEGQPQPTVPASAPTATHPNGTSATAPNVIASGGNAVPNVVNPPSSAVPPSSAPGVPPVVAPISQPSLATSDAPPPAVAPTAPTASSPSPPPSSHVPGPVEPPKEEESAADNKETAPTTTDASTAAPTGTSGPATPPSDQPSTLDLASLNFEELPAQFKTEGSDYKVVYNPNIPRKLNIEQVHTLPHNSVVCCVRFSADGKYLATGCNHIAQIYDVQTGQLCVRLHDASADESKDLYIRSVCFSPDGKFLATGAEDHKVRIWDIQKREIVHTLQGHTQEIYSLAYSNHNGRFLVSGSGDRYVKVWDTENGQVIREFQIEDGVTAVAVSPDDLYVAAGSLDREIRIWDINNGELVTKLGTSGENGHQDSVYSVAYMPNGRELISGSLDRTVKVWELGADPKVQVTIQGPSNYVLSVAVTPDSKWILSGSKDQSVHLWDSETGTVQLMLQAHTNSVISVAPSPEGQLFASGGGDSFAKVWRYDYV